MKKLVSFLLCIVLISGCGKQPNKSQPDKTDTKAANQVSPSPSPSPSPTPTPSPTSLPLPEEQSSIPVFSDSEYSKTQIGIGIGSVVTVLIIFGVIWKRGCCCFKSAKSLTRS